MIISVGGAIQDRFMDPLHFSIALGPLAVYLLLLALINLSSRPFLTTGARDTAALGVAVSGFVIAGPMELFMPEAAATHFGPWVWLMLLAFYGLCLTLLVLLVRPRLVIYNMTPDQIRPILAELAKDMDEDARWAGETLVMPHLGVHLHVESFAPLRNVQLIANGSQQNYGGWRQLEIGLYRILRESKALPNPYGFFLMSLSMIIGVMVMVWMLADREGVAQALGEMLRR